MTHLRTEAITCMFTSNHNKMDLKRDILGYIPGVTGKIGTEAVVLTSCIEDTEEAYFTDLTRSDMAESVGSSDCENLERQVQQNIMVSWEKVTPIVACLQSVIRFILQTEIEQIHTDVSELHLHVTDKHGNDVKSSVSAVCDSTFEAKFIPPCEGHCALYLSCDMYKFESNTYEVNVDSNSPVVNFSDDNNWPLAICLGNKDDIYVAYMHHVAHFSQDGEYLNQLFYDRDCVITDIAFSAETGPTPEIAVAMTGVVREGHWKSRQQDVRIYNEDGDVVFTFTGKPFSVKFIRIATFKDKYFISVKNGVFICNNQGIVEDQVSVKDLSGVSRLSVTSTGDIVIADSWSGCVKVFDRNGNVHQTIQCYRAADNGDTVNKNISVISSSEDTKYKDTQAMVTSESFNNNEAITSSDVVDDEACIDIANLNISSCSDGQKVPVGSLTGVAVDSCGHILVSDSLEQTIKVYCQDGSYVGCIDSQWDPLQWPLGIAVSHDGHVFVADHGNGCIKKYKYKIMDLAQSKNS